MNLYANVFIEAAHTASVIPFANNVTYFSMHGFGGFNMPLAFALATLGAFLGAKLNWIIGKAFSRLPGAKKYTSARAFFQRHGMYLLLFSFLPLLNFTSLAAGFLGLRARVAMPLCLISWAGYYGYFLLY